MFCNNEYDVVVIGAGPGGSVAARNLSRAGHKVLLLEKREKIGYPVRCGEASTKLSDLQTYGPIDEDCIETIINGLYIYGPNGVNIDLAQKGTGIMLNREKFDPWLAHLAANDGVEVVTRARAEFVGDVESGTRLVRVKLGEGAGETTEEVRAKMVIAADGVESRIGRQVGLDCLQKPGYTARHSHQARLPHVLAGSRFHQRRLHLEFPEGQIQRHELRRRIPDFEQSRFKRLGHHDGMAVQALPGCKNQSRCRRRDSRLERSQGLHTRPLCPRWRRRPSHEPAYRWRHRGRHARRTVLCPDRPRGLRMR